MKRGKDEDKMMGPMFPRLHVNDTEKGGPRAPPRNKMALYEQLSIPSQKFTHAKPNSSIRNLVPQSSQGSVNERGMFSPQHPIRHQSEKQYCQYFDSSTSPAQIEQRKKLDEDDFRVPIFIHSIPNLRNGELKFQKDVETDAQKERNSSPISNLSDSSPRHETREKSANSIDRSKSNASILPEHCAKSYDTESRENVSCSMSETSIVDSISGLDITPDDVVGVMGQNQFWKARRAIVNQQRAFSVQLFELHRLIKVQRSIATSPHLLQEETTYSGKPSKPSPIKKLPLNNHPVKALPIITKKKDDPEKTTHKECSAENTIEKSSFSSVQNVSTPISAPSFNNSDHNARPLCISQPHGQQWLIPVMSPSEGLVYKPYPGPGFGPGFGPAFAGPASNGVMGNFVTPPYGYQTPPYHPSFFPPYGMPVMNTASFSNQSVEQMNQFPTQEANFRVHPNVEVQASTASSPSEGENDMLPLFPTNSSPHTPEPERPPRVIKVVPHNARTATESVARIFRSIQEERKGCDTV